MKKIFVLISLIICISQFSFSQITWCPADAKWHYGYSAMISSGYVETIYVSDTLFAGENCKKLKEHIQRRDIFGGPIINEYRDIYTYENNNIIFVYDIPDILNNGNSEWDTLINFNALPGDKWHWNSIDTSFIQVEDTGHKIINTYNLKWLYVSYHTPTSFGVNLQYDTIYNRIGFAGEVYAFRPEIVFVTDGNLVGFCNYIDSSFAIYGNPDSACTQLPSGINEIKKNNVTVSIYPNPFSESTTIAVDGMNGTFDFTLNNVLGMKMNELKNVKTSQFNFNRNDLPAGIYFYSISVEGKNRANGKLVIE